MFTGIIEETGMVRAVKNTGNSLKLTIAAAKVLQGTKLGDSIAVNGICLTVDELGRDSFTADVMSETLARTSLKDAAPGSRVNLERALAAGDRLGGHIVSGHIDGTGKIIAITTDGIARRITIAAPPPIMRLIVEKGSIAIDGVSLTVASAGEREFTVSVIPHTMANTILPSKKAGDAVNLENDCIGKYVEKLLAAGGFAGKPAAGSAGSVNGGVSGSGGGNGVTAGFLAENGFL